ncbi:hypothetical protein EXIGLDRAFT_568177, partial [Exidia glandulosa HHB12029]
FPCAPKRPSVAFNIRLLEFISLHSLHVAPNTTAWATTLESFWAKRGYAMHEAPAFRKRLANAMHWFDALNNLKDAYVSHSIDVLGKSIVWSAEFTNSDQNTMQAPRTKPLSGSGSVQSSKNLRASAFARPSSYLRKRCPLCFGG